MDDRTGMLRRHAAVGLLGPRQAGKTTLALEIAAGRSNVYLDLESESDRAKLADAGHYLGRHEDRLVILDEIQRAPGLFQTLRGLIDAGRRRGRRTGRFLILGSASLDLLQQSAESLAGRIAYVELAPFDALEVRGGRRERLWLRGGFPDSFLARTDAASLEWRQAFIRTYLERDVPQLGPRIPAETLRRFWTMLAHAQGGTLNAARLASGLGISGQSVVRYLDLLADLLLVRRLAPWTANVGKRLVRSPKVYVRDSGIAHALLGIGDLDTLLGHPVAGPSWEGFAIENLVAAAPPGTQAGFYRTAGGAEADLVLALAPARLWAIEIKRSLAPKPERGFREACADLGARKRLIVYPGEERFSVGPGMEAIGLTELMHELRRSRR
ncbi:MAG: ATP-binding protein [Betaproteobacteria bacterium]|nr:ATP-binding protein [Betaproteobacteria bacterium]